MNFDFTRNFDELTDLEKLDWAVECNIQNEAEVKKFAKKNGLPIEACKSLLESVNPLARWYEAQTKEARRLAREEKRIQKELDEARIRLAELTR